jgi:hypothetical protein
MKLIMNTSAHFRIEEKRFQVPAVLVGECPKCLKPFRRDFLNYFLMSPIANKTIPINCWCEECGHEWSVKGFLAVKLELVDDSPTETMQSVPVEEEHRSGA